MTEDRDGQVVTFYSYKGGTGRTMALANVAWILAANGKRVLVVDWDLESPGLHRFFHPFIDPDAFATTGGVVNLVRDYVWEAADEQSRTKSWIADRAKVQQHAFSLNWTFPDGGGIDFLAAGKQDSTYAATLSAMDWDNFHDQFDGGTFLEALRTDMTRHYDYTLIDSRTGLSDVADICTIHLPDTVVACFTYSDQGIDGAAEVARRLRDRYRRRKIRVLPVPMRVDPSEKAKADTSLAVARQRFAGFPTDMDDRERDTYWSVLPVPYRAFYGYEELLATFFDPPGSPISLLAAYERLTAYISGNGVAKLPAMDDALRRRGQARFVRQLNVSEAEVVLRYAPDDHVWAEWIETILAAADVRVFDPRKLAADGAAVHESDHSGVRDLVIVSPVNKSQWENRRPAEHGGAGPLLIYIADVLPLHGYPIADSAFIKGLSAATAVEALLKLVGHDKAKLDPDIERTARFPGADATISNLPPRNIRFTGREVDIRELRSSLRDGGTALLTSTDAPIALKGLGGVGKTQVALEYAHRFKSAYDVIWWVVSEPATFVDTEIADLGLRLNLLPQPSAGESARATVQALEAGRMRWLLIFDNAEDIDTIRPFLPQHGGNVIITARNQKWSEFARTVDVDVFKRSESIQHLYTRVPSLRRDEADKIADLLGDLPIAVAAAGAWLAESGARVDDYIRHLERHGPDAYVQATWDLSFERLAERSPAAYRLLQLCSLMGPEIALDLVESDAMADNLVELDAQVSDRYYRGSLVQAINVLALLKLDAQGGRQIHIHRVVQQALRNRMGDAQLTPAMVQVQRVLAAARPAADVEDARTWDGYRTLWPHLEVSGAMSSADKSVRQLFVDRLRYLRIRGDFREGTRLAVGVQAAWSAMLAAQTDPATRDELNTQLLQVRFNHATILRDQSKFAEARAMDEEVLAAQRALLGQTHPHTLMTAGGLAADLRALGDYADALEQDKITYAAWSNRFGDDNPRTLASLNNLASSYRLVGDFREAIAHDQQAYERRQLAGGESDFNTLHSAGGLARDMRDAGDYNRSVALLESVVATLTERFGRVFRPTLLAQANLAVSLRAAGRPQDAMELLESAYENLLTTIGPTSPDTQSCRLSRAMNLLAMGSPSRAADELREIRLAYESSLGPNHPHTLVCVSNMAAVARADKDYDQARSLADEAAGSLSARVGPDHPYTLAARMNVASFTAEGGAPQAALTLMWDVTERLTAVLGPEHPDALRSRANLSIALHELDEFDAAINAAEIAERLARQVGPGHPAVIALHEWRYLHRIVEPHPF